MTTRKSGFNWYVLEFCSARTARVFSHLERLGVTFWCPLTCSHYRRSDKNCFRRKEVPLFPGYVFIKIDFNKTHSTTVTLVPWVKSFVSFGGEPVPVCEEIILGLRRRETNYWGEYSPIRGIPHELAEILLENNPMKRSFLFFKYLSNTQNK
ncbi:transcription termination/antitermination factor NusG [Escherichia coli]|uniref:transcription termination/antitermination NusG family protein n=1 Tax=Escherichia coli TaxID=562 RepID=UPI001CD9AA28|nr:transcription termination/antitermination NusG family protein [Escherichia coli]EIT9647931.1 transcription termination/antitermination factor NusG [Escherichia coli]MCA2038922.1 transcription termination/antitermination factor NusG [Escherichia coli]MCA2102036.1 transcription termination/antitermination factor NusG [Escherichia coli]MCA2107377.1 transcription termination/antitermination factor NusG [Escherichia coli]MCA2116306.1 transcription termination/antitermination factor NusG [Escheri